MAAEHLFTSESQRFRLAGTLQELEQRYLYLRTQNTPSKILNDLAFEIHRLRTQKADIVFSRAVQESEERFLGQSYNWAKPASEATVTGVKPAAKPVTPSLFKKYATKRNLLIAGGAAMAAWMILPKRDDNIIEGLRHGGFAQLMRQDMTDFGSGYQGPNPNITPSYNIAKDVPRYQVMRGSQLGKSEAELYRYFTKDEEPSEFLAASASAGTALHMLEEAKKTQSGEAVGAEELLWDPVRQISGHVDLTYAGGEPVDIKTVSAKRFAHVQKYGAFKKHVSQLNWYMNMKNAERGYLEYVSRDDPSQRALIEIDYDQQLLEKDIARLEKVRGRVKADIESGRLEAGALPKTASIETLRKADAEREELHDIDELERTFQEEMRYLKRVEQETFAHRILKGGKRAANFISGIHPGSEGMGAQSIRAHSEFGSGWKKKFFDIFLKSSPAEKQTLTEQLAFGYGGFGTSRGILAKKLTEASSFGSEVSKTLGSFAKSRRQPGLASYVPESLLSKRMTEQPVYTGRGFSRKQVGTELQEVVVRPKEFELSEIQKQAALLAKKKSGFSHLKRQAGGVSEDITLYHGSSLRMIENLIAKGPTSVSDALARPAVYYHRNILDRIPKYARQATQSAPGDIPAVLITKGKGGKIFHSPSAHSGFGDEYLVYGKDWRKLEHRYMPLSDYEAFIAKRGRAPNFNEAHSPIQGIHPGSEGMGAQSIRAHSEFGSGYVGRFLGKVGGLLKKKPSALPVKGFSQAEIKSLASHARSESVEQFASRLGVSLKEMPEGLAEKFGGGMNVAHSEIVKQTDLKTRVGTAAMGWLGFKPGKAYVDPAFLENNASRIKATIFHEATELRNVGGFIGMPQEKTMSLLTSRAHHRMAVAQEELFVRHFGSKSFYKEYSVFRKWHDPYYPGYRFSAKDDAFNTIEGLRHEGLAPELRKALTDFGSGYQGPKTIGAAFGNLARATEKLPPYMLLPEEKLSGFERILRDIYVKKIAGRPYTAESILGSVPAKTFFTRQHAEIRLRVERQLRAEPKVADPKIFLSRAGIFEPKVPMPQPVAKPKILEGFASVPRGPAAIKGRPRIPIPEEAGMIRVAEAFKVKSGFALDKTLAEDISFASTELIQNTFNPGAPKKKTASGAFRALGKGMSRFIRKIFKIPFSTSHGYQGPEGDLDHIISLRLARAAYSIWNQEEKGTTRSKAASIKCISSWAGNRASNAGRQMRNQELNRAVARNKKFYNQSEQSVGIGLKAAHNGSRGHSNFTSTG